MKILIYYLPITFLVIIVIFFSGCTGISPLRHHEVTDKFSKEKMTWWSQNPRDGDFWIGVNLYPDEKGYRRYDTSRYGFALNFRTVQYVPGEVDYGVVLWVARPGPPAPRSCAPP